MSDEELKIATEKYLSRREVVAEELNALAKAINEGVASRDPEFFEHNPASFYPTADELASDTEHLRGVIKRALTVNPVRDKLTEAELRMLGLPLIGDAKQVVLSPRSSLVPDRAPRPHPPQQKPWWFPKK